MESLKNFLRNFSQNKGQHVFLSLLIAKICAFLGSLFIIRILPESEFGMVSIVASVFAIFAPFSGFGSHQSLLRFGSITSDITNKKELSTYLLRKGFTYQVLLSAIFLLVSVFYINKYEEILFIFILFSVRLIGVYFLNFIQSEFRIFGNNQKFAEVNNVVNLLGLLLLLGSTFFLGLTGYLLAIAFTPFLALFWFKKNHLITLGENFSLNKKEIWNYGLYSAGTAILSDALFSADILLLSFMMNESAVANYKVAILIPANITFLALTFMQSDFPILAKNYQNKIFLKDYIANYYKIFIPVVLLILGIGFVYKSEILNLFFSEKYADNALIFFILLAGFSANMLFRNLYGNLLSAVGKMRINSIISFLTLGLLLFLSFNLIKYYGIIGMSISLTVSMFVGGLLLMFSFYYYYKNLK